MKKCIKHKQHLNLHGRKYNATLTKSTRIFNTTDVVKKYDPSSEDLIYAGINVIEPSKIFNIIQY